MGASATKNSSLPAFASFSAESTTLSASASFPSAANPAACQNRAFTLSVGSVAPARYASISLRAAAQSPFAAFTVARPLCDTAIFISTALRYSAAASSSLPEYSSASASESCPFASAGAISTYLRNALTASSHFFRPTCA